MPANDEFKQNDDLIERIDKEPASARAINASVRIAWINYKFYLE